MLKLLSAILLCLGLHTAQAQLVFTPTEWDFGTVQEADGRVAHTFTGENRGKIPVLILDVVTTCGCTIPEFSKQPILPGGKTTVVVAFDPTNRPGTFSKELYVYSDERLKVATLTIRGNVAARTKTAVELYPVDAGHGLRLSTALCAFSYVYQGQPVYSTIGYANTSEQALSLDLRKAEQSGLMTHSYPRKIAPGEQGEITFGYAIPADKPHYGTLKDLLTVYVNGRSNNTQLLVHGIAIDKPGDVQQAPKSEVSANIIKFGTVKRSAPIQRYALTLSNTGRGTLVIRAVETDGRIGCTLKAGREIPAGGVAKIEVTLDPSAQEYGVLTDLLTLITNDPNRPMRRIRATAIIED